MITKDEKINEIISNQINYIRRMSLLTDEQLNLLLRKQITEHPHLIDNYMEEEQKKMTNDFIKAAKDIKSNSLKIARLVA